MLHKVWDIYSKRWVLSVFIKMIMPPPKKKKQQQKTKISKVSDQFVSLCIKGLKVNLIGLSYGMQEGQKLLKTI